MARPRTRTIRRRQLLSLLQEGIYDSRGLTEALELPSRSLARLLNDLRDEGHHIIAVRDRASWSYRIDPPARGATV